MNSYPKFRNMSSSFWAFVKFISQELGYTDRKTKSVRIYSENEIAQLLKSHNLTVDTKLVENAVCYSKLRAHTLNSLARGSLMDAESARIEFEKLYNTIRNDNYLCNIPMNKQKGELKQIAYFTAIINILTERTLRNAGLCANTKGFNDDPHRLIYVIDNDRRIVGASSRRMDGAYPDTINPKIIWEIKEYYYTTTFGSRVADGVYETQLDGYELNNFSKYTSSPIKHVLFIDGYKTWWTDGKSYLCRIVDILNAGLVDEVIIGREVLERWPNVLQTML